MFVWAKIPERWSRQMDSVNFAMKLIEEADVAVSPGAGFGPAGLRRLFGHGTVVGELDDEHLHLRTELPPPAGEQLAHPVAVAGDADVALALVPGGAPETDPAERRNHPVVHHADPRVGVPRRARR